MFVYAKKKSVLSTEQMSMFPELEREEKKESCHHIHDDEYDDDSFIVIMGKKFLVQEEVYN